MNLRRFYTERLNLRVGSSVKLPDSEIPHIRNSLRMEVGDEIILFNGEKEFKATLYKVSREVVMAKISAELGSEASGSTAGAEITLFQAIIKIPQFELIVEKTTELGVHEIVPVAAEFSQIKHNFFLGKVPRLEKIVLSACKQSERISIPKIGEIHSFEQMLGRLNEFDLFMFATIARGSLSNYADVLKPIKEVVANVSKGSKIAIAIGPEGGFSPTEHKKFTEHQSSKAQMVAITPTILRAETAAITAVGYTVLAA